MSIEEAVAGAMDDVFGTNNVEEVKAMKEQAKAKRQKLKQNNPLSTMVRNIIDFKSKEVGAVIMKSVYHPEVEAMQKQAGANAERAATMDELNAEKTRETIVSASDSKSGKKSAQPKAKPERSAAIRMLEQDLEDTAETCREKQREADNGMEY